MFQSLRCALALAMLVGIAGHGKAAAEDATMATLSVPGRPFMAVPSRDGKFLFVSVADGRTGGVAVFENKPDAGFVRTGFVSMEGPAAGLALTPDQRTLLVADGVGVALFDVASLEASAAATARYLNEGDAGTTEVAVTHDGSLAFASDENSESVSVIDMTQPQGPAIVGHVPVDCAPVGLAIDPDDRVLYVTSEADKDRHAGCVRTFGPPPRGTLSAIDVRAARTDPAHARIGKISVGRSPVRVVLSRAGDVAWVSLRGEDAIAAYDTAKVRGSLETAERARVRVGLSPIGIAVVLDGSAVVVANSARFAAGAPRSTIDTIVTETALQGATGTNGSMPVGRFPREIVASADERRLFLTNFASNSVEVIDVGGLPVCTGSEAKLDCKSILAPEPSSAATP